MDETFIWFVSAVGGGVTSFHLKVKTRSAGEFHSYRHLYRHRSPTNPLESDVGKDVKTCLSRPGQKHRQKESFRKEP